MHLPLVLVDVVWDGAPLADTDRDRHIEFDLAQSPCWINSLLVDSEAGIGSTWLQQGEGSFLWPWQSLLQILWNYRKWFLAEYGFATFES